MFTFLTSVLQIIPRHAFKNAAPSRDKWHGSISPGSRTIQDILNKVSKHEGNDSKQNLKKSNAVGRNEDVSNYLLETEDDKHSYGHKKKEPVTKVLESSEESDGNLDDFLAKFRSKTKSPERKNDDLSNFIVSSEDTDSDEFSTPKLSLRDRIMKGKTTQDVSSSSYRTTTQIPDSDSDDELPDIPPILNKNPKSGSKKEKLRLPSSRETSEKEDTPISPKPVRKTSTAKKTYVIDSDSETSNEDVSDSPYYSDDPPISLLNTKTKPPPPNTGVKSSKDVVSTSQADSSSRTFLSSLSEETDIHRCHPDAKKYITKFSKSKEELSKRLYHLFNTECFDSCLPEDFEISWNVRLTKTAGLCHSRRYRDRHGIEVRSSRIELSTKVVDSCDRLRDTLIHEMCHAASWVISGYRDGHGPLWKTWANKAMVRFPELPVIGRCHSYKIRTKFTYKCEKCGYCVGRHSKSLDTARKVCGHCHGRFQLVVNYKGTKENEAGDSAAKTPKPPNPFALFVKENYKTYKKPGVSHGDVMKVLGETFKEVNIGKN